MTTATRLLIGIGLAIQLATALLTPRYLSKNDRALIQRCNLVNTFAKRRSVHGTNEDMSVDEKGKDLEKVRKEAMMSHQEYAKVPSQIHENHLSRRDILHAAAATSVYCAAGPKTALADNNDNIEAKSPFITFAKNFVRDDDAKKSSNVANKIENPLDSIGWDGPKNRGLNTERMADAINDGLIENEWFVTGKGKPELFSTNFKFSDPDVSLAGYEEYCRSVRRLFDQDTARCELVCCSVTAPNTITVLRRNSGRVNLGPLQVELKPYLVTTTLVTDPEDGNLVASQVDEFEADGLGLVLYQIPFLRPLAGSPAPSVDVLKKQCTFYTCKISA